MVMIETRPQNKYDRVIVGNIAHYEVYFNIEFNQDRGLYQWEVVRVDEMKYDKLVSAIIKSHFNDDKIQAIINNYLLDSSEEHVKEFNELQEWRKRAKQIAKEILA